MASNPEEGTPSPRRKSLWQTAAGGWRKVAPGQDRPQELTQTVDALGGNTPGTGTRIVDLAKQAEKDQQQSGRGSNYDLWKAAKDGNEKRVEKALEDKNVRINYEVIPDDLDEDTLWYKNRKVTSQAIHAATLCPRAAKAFACVKLLVEKGKADVKAKAYIMEGEVTRELEAIHMAAGVGNAKIVEYLIRQNADPNAEALVGVGGDKKSPHYYPIHDAVWFNRKASVKVLLDKLAEAMKKNNDGNTALHLAARMGHDKLVKFILYDRHKVEEDDKESPQEEDEQRDHALAAKDSQEKEKHENWRSKMKESLQMVKCQNSKKEDPLTVAVERGHFPANQLYLFTRCFDSLDKQGGMEGRVQAFKKVAKTCPDAAPKLIRTHPRTDSSGKPLEDEAIVRNAELKNAEISKEWRESIHTGAEKGKISVKDLCELIDIAPMAAVDLLDMLTTAPKEENRQHNPLPVRANIPYDQEACRLSCVYIEDSKWTWKGAEKSNPIWQEKLAPQDAKRSQEVKVKMLMLPGVMNSYLVHSLAATKDHKIFTKLVIHALLKHLWKSFRPLFLVDLGHQFLSTVVLSYWILIASQVETPRMLRCGLWGILAAEGISECFMFIWTCVVCQSHLGRRLFIRYVKREYYRFVMGGCALALAIETSPDFQPADNSSILLSINSLLHWITMLFEIRAFRSTGRRILPIMKSVLPIVGMLVIMLFISLAFMHAFWAMDRSGINEISMFNIVVLLFTGEQFLSPEDLLEMPQSKRTAMVLLSIGGVFIFLTCTINVFIAVLSDCYDHEQERMVCTFLKERARICSSYFFRPKIKSLGFGFNYRGITKLSWWRWWFLIVLILGLYIALLYGITELGFLTLWLSAIFPAAAVLCVQGLLRDVASVGWKTNYLWFCHEVDVEEEMFLAPEQRDEEESNGRISRMKKYIKSTMKSCDHNIQALSIKVEDLHRNTKSELASMSELLCKACSSGPRCSDLPFPRFKEFKGLFFEEGMAMVSPQNCHERQELVDVLTSARGRGSKEAPSPRVIPPLQLTMRPLPPTGTYPNSIEAPEATFGLPPFGSQQSFGAGGAEQELRKDLEQLREEVSTVNQNLEDLQTSVEEQQDEQKKLQRTCEDIQRLLEKVVEMAEARHNRKSKTRGTPSPDDAGDPKAQGSLKLPDEVLGRGNDWPDPQGMSSHVVPDLLK